LRGALLPSPFYGVFIMAITNTYKGDKVVVAHPGQDGFFHARLTLDGSATSASVVLPSTAGGKTILGCIGGTSNNIPSAGVAGTTGFTAKFAAGTNAEFLDLLIIVAGR